MKRAIIFANGELNHTPHLLNDLKPDDLIIAADGGASHCLRLGIRPHVVVGDFDSLQPEDLLHLQTSAIQLVRYPSHKDETDLELAFHHAQAQGCQQITVIGALGARWDMSIANLLLAAHPKFSTLKVQLLDDHQELMLLHSAEKHVLQGIRGDTLSLIPLTSRVAEITTQGLEYPLINEDLLFGSPRGVSNVFTGEEASVIFSAGLLMCVIIRHGGIECTENL